jgi:hypothetical protein
VRSKSLQCWTLRGGVPCAEELDISSKISMVMTFFFVVLYVGRVWGESVQDARCLVFIL